MSVTSLPASRKRAASTRSLQKGQQTRAAILDAIVSAGDRRAVPLLCQMLEATDPFGGSHDVALGHRRRYRRDSLRAVLERAGFEVELCSYIMVAALPPAALLRLLERLPGRRPPAGHAESGYVPIPRWLNEVLSHLVGVDGWLAGRVPLPFGLTVTAVARRPVA